MKKKKNSELSRGAPELFGVKNGEQISYNRTEQYYMKMNASSVASIFLLLQISIRYIRNNKNNGFTKINTNENLTVYQKKSYT